MIKPTMFDAFVNTMKKSHIAKQSAKKAVAHAQQNAAKLEQTAHDILTKSFALQNDRANFRQNDRVKHQRAHASLLIDRVNLVFNRARTTLIFHKRQRNAADRNRKLRHYRVAQYLGGDGRTIRNIKYVTINSIIHFAHPGADIIL